MFLVQAGACAAVHSWAAMFVLAGSSRVNVCRRDVTAERNHRKTSHINAKFLANTPPRRHALFVFQVVMFRCYLLLTAHAVSLFWERNVDLRAAGHQHP